MTKAEQLKSGLQALGPNFSAEICTICDGAGQYVQTYTAGCGMGYYRSMGRCDWCAGKGLLQGDVAAPDSVVNQVMTAGSEKNEQTN